MTERWQHGHYAPLLTSRAAALCDLGQWRQAQAVIGRVSDSKLAASVVNRIKRARPELYPSSPIDSQR